MSVSNTKATEPTWTCQECYHVFYSADAYLVHQGVHRLTKERANAGKGDAQSLHSSRQRSATPLAPIQPNIGSPGLSAADDTTKKQTPAADFRKPAAKRKEMPPPAKREAKRRVAPVRAGSVAASEPSSVNVFDARVPAASNVNLLGGQELEPFQVAPKSLRQDQAFTSSNDPALPMSRTKAKKVLWSPMSTTMRNNLRHILHAVYQKTLSNAKSNASVDVPAINKTLQKLVTEMDEDMLKLMVPASMQPASLDHRELPKRVDDALEKVEEFARDKLRMEILSHLDARRLIRHRLHLKRIDTAAPPNIERAAATNEPASLLENPAIATLMPSIDFTHRHLYTYGDIALSYPTSELVDRQ
ncbi:hypothetical protein BC940DRAFT_368266 [Gongronella butleri]|nr:hypothetical protein BC940DRAFT_368266 [Gongronella butleri]